MSGNQHKSIARSLGEFVGHIWRGVRSDPEAAHTREVRREVTEEHRQVDDHRITLRRTIIEEIEVHPKDGDPEPR